MVMEEEELKKWKNENLPKYYRDVSILFKKEVDENIILDLLKNKFDIEIIDVYEGSNIKNGFKSITFRIYSYKKDDLKALEESFLEVVKNIGGIERY